MPNKTTHNEEKNKQRLEGVIVSDKMNKTRVVEVVRLYKHPKYGKFLTRSKKYKAHDENNEHKMGEKVTIESCRPMSRDKHFVIVNN